MFKLLNTHKKYEEAQPDGAAGGDTGSQETNTEPNKSEFDTMWETQKAQPAQPAQPAQQPAPLDIDAHIQSLNLAGKVDQDKMQAALNGDTAAMQALLEAPANNLYKQMLGDVNKLINAKLSESETKLVTGAEDKINMVMAMNTLAAEIPESQNPAVKPMAEAAFTQFLSKHSLSEAIAKTRQYFTHVGQTLGDPQTSKVGHGTQLAGGAGNNNPEEDWLAVLKGKE